MKANKLRKEWKNIFFNLIFALATIILVILFQHKIVLATILLFIVTLIGLFKWKSKMTVLLFIFGAIFGTIAEMISINFGVWSYSAPSFLGVPLWLFIVWGNTCAFLYETSLEIKRLGLARR